MIHTFFGFLESGFAGFILINPTNPDSKNKKGTPQYKTAF
jgi:hypothetical protein